MRGNAGCGFESAAAAALALYLFVAQLDQAVAFAIAAYHFFLGAARFHGCLPLQSADLRLRAGESYGACLFRAPIPLRERESTIVLALSREHDQRPDTADQRAGQQEILHEHKRLPRRFDRGRHAVNLPGNDRRRNGGHVAPMCLGFRLYRHAPSLAAMITSWRGRARLGYVGAGRQKVRRIFAALYYAVIAGPDLAIHERARRQKTYVRMVR